jgi:hypothetical protein
MRDEASEYMSRATTVYVRLRDESVDVWRPVDAEHVDGNVYLILSQPYDREIERWEFQPGDRVICEYVQNTDGRTLAAVRLAR